MDNQTPNQTSYYRFEEDGKFYVSYNKTVPSLDQALVHCWKENATAAVPYPKLSHAIVGKYANQPGRYAMGLSRLNISGTKWTTYDGEYELKVFFFF
jgi:hypothetical protein